MKTKTHLQIHLTNVDSNDSSSPSPSPPSSPRRPSRTPHCRRRSRSKAQAISEIFVGFLFRRCIRAFLLLPLFYLSGILMCAGTFSFLSRQTYLPGSMYRSGEVFKELWPKMQLDTSVIEFTTVWKHNRRLGEQIPCTKSTSKHLGSHASSGYLVVEANGGLNQQRSSICNAVALAGLLNAVLVIPKFYFHSIWKDPSEFKDIYDEDHFIRTLQGHVRVVRELPEMLMEKYGYNTSNIPTFRVKAWAPASYYLEVVYPILCQKGVIRISPFANRLAVKVPPNIQCLRCLANYEALRFSAPIEALAKELVNRMIARSSTAGGEYVSVHLRFEEDMVAFSCCEYDGGKTEKREMESARERGWKGKFSQQGRVISPGLNRMNGRCPLAPLEVGMMLRGMGFDNNTLIYLASGKIYHAERNLAPLLQMFPLLQTKESLATPEELAYFKGYSSRLAALDYRVCLFSEVFVTTQGGNFPHFLMGHRRYLYNGHAKTIKPDKRKMVILLQNASISWEVFKHQMESMLDESDRKGISLRKRKQSVYAHPLPECTCCRHPNNSVKSSSPLI